MRFAPRPALVVMMGAALASACGKGSHKPGAGTASGTATGRAGGSSPGSGPGTARAHNEYAPFVPAASRRDTPPPAMAETALAVGAAAPVIDAASTRGRFVLGDALTRHAWVIVVLYRGDW